MRKETAFLVGFLVLTIGTASLIWMFALPNFKPVSFPHVASGQIEVGPMRHKRALTADEVQTVNTWLDNHKAGWGPLSRTPPSSGDSRVMLKDANGKDALALTLWTGISAADWNDTVFAEAPDGSEVHMETFSEKEFAPLRGLVDRFKFKRSAFP
ncbi:hypothetical protein [Acetobacter indonesiensis]|jgi:hypothetical protein|uniref:Uncharacterized protein n=1 Tax=Acetobacter indonesiensis TaxID=104101 RepID=A0A252ATU0_9PROT|nr:hypothetical protein [Acetobacter indonesiensis]MCG0995000.1 hypothetical protein [Acetobacter indonesiensis]MCI1437377.1 hypothetical protein [Acetobacter indonesiensis]MCI1546456.1 hypothetical protein [Acetobacter indonesiensis]MCI1765001.1 hypothetical protein [Acetobacter indonesiensis]MCP1230229.1 hypothetical protein [Acetobacter indonesiensis]